MNDVLLNLITLSIEILFIKGVIFSHLNDRRRDKSFEKKNFKYSKVRLVKLFHEKV